MLAEKVHEILDLHKLVRRQTADLLDRLLLAALSNGHGVHIRSGHPSMEGSSTGPFTAESDATPPAGSSRMEDIPVTCYAPPAAKAAGNTFGKVLNNDRQPGAFARFTVVCRTARQNAATLRPGRRAAKK